MTVHRREKCRACGSCKVRLIHDFGEQPLAGYFPRVPESVRPAPRYRLDLSQCDDCALLQVTNLPPIEEVFHKDYRYSSSTIPDLVRHFEGYADWIAGRLPVDASVLEFGCNDGVLLSKLAARGFGVVGIDASENVAMMARQRGLDVRTGFMSEDMIADGALAHRFDMVTCSNVFAHIDDLSTTIAAVARALRPGGLFAIEVHDGEVLASERQFETIYHEHLTYFTEQTLRRLTGAHGFAFVECPRTSMHGGGLRFLCRLDPEAASPAPPVCADERIDGGTFAQAVEESAREIRALAGSHGQLDGYGAAGRSQMFLNMTATADCFARVFDDSPLRQDRYIAGTNIPIVPFEGRAGSACVILAWNYASTIAERIRGSYRSIFTVLPRLRDW